MPSASRAARVNVTPASGLDALILPVTVRIGFSAGVCATTGAAMNRAPTTRSALKALLLICMIISFTS